jgi:hypothetical protein
MVALGDVVIFKEKVLEALGAVHNEHVVTVEYLFEDDDDMFSDELSLQEEEKLEDEIENDYLLEVLDIHKECLSELETSRDQRRDSDKLLHVSLDDIKSKNDRKRGNTEKSGEYVEVKGDDGFVYFSADKRLRRCSGTEELEKVFYESLYYI